MNQDEITRLFIDQLQQSSKDQKEGLSKIADSLNALNESNVLHSESVKGMNNTVQAHSEAIRAMTEEAKQYRLSIRFLQVLILLLVFTLIVVAGAERVFQYTSWLRLP